VNDHYHELGQEAIHAIRLEEAATLVLRDTQLSVVDRAVLENTVRIARMLQKALRMAG
jgi:tartrate dehydratase beta subunit/fumarate hydratase class I family protein